MSFAVTNGGAFSVRVQGELTVLIQDGEKFVQAPLGAIVLQPGESVIASGDVKISSPVIAEVSRLRPKAESPEPPGAA